MANDREILREIWEGKIPVHFKLASDETDVEPEEFFLLIPRLSYFPLVTDKVRKHFLRFISNELQDGEMWMESNGTPLKWHYPIGVLFDLLVGADAILPWHITVHFSNFPEDVLFRCPNKDIVEAHFMSGLKEADVLKHRGQVVSAMQKKDHNQLWLGLVNDKFDQFWAVNRRLMEPIPDQDGFKHIPVRCYAEKSNQTLHCVYTRKHHLSGDDFHPQFKNWQNSVLLLKISKLIFVILAQVQCLL